LGEAIYPGSAWEEVRSLAPREQFMVTIAVPTRPDVTFVGQLLDSADNSWISGAKVTLLDGSMTFLAELIQDPSLCFAFEPRELSASTPRWMTVESDGAGFFELHIASWIVLDERRASFVRIEAPSYSPVRVCLESGHETSETAAPIHLTRSASIVASVRDEFGQAAPGIDVRVVLQHKNGRAALEASRELDWEARTNAMGVCNFADLPARVPLRVELFTQGRFVPQSDRPLVLTPGEERCIDLRFGD
jgi:hypothetical protein